MIHLNTYYASQPADTQIVPGDAMRCDATMCEYVGIGETHVCAAVYCGLMSFSVLIYRLLNGRIKLNEIVW